MITNYVKMVEGVASQSKNTQECGSLQDRIPDHVFIHVLEPDMHGRVRYQPPTVRQSFYHDNLRMHDLRQRVEMA